MICAGSLTADIISDVCLGDSGGGLICENKLVGIVSQGHPESCGVPDYHVVTTNVLYYIEWIYRNINLFRLTNVNNYSLQLILPLELGFFTICAIICSSKTRLGNKRKTFYFLFYAGFPTGACTGHFVFLIQNCYTNNLNCELFYLGITGFYIVREALLAYLGGITSSPSYISFVIVVRLFNTLALLFVIPVVFIFYSNFIPTVNCIYISIVINCIVSIIYYFINWKFSSNWKFQEVTRFFPVKWFPPLVHFFWIIYVWLSGLLSVEHLISFALCCLFFHIL